MVPRLIVCVRRGRWTEESLPQLDEPCCTVLHTLIEAAVMYTYIKRERIDRSVSGCYFFAGRQRQLESGGVLRVPACEFKRHERLLTELGGLNTPAARLGSQLARRCGNKTRK